MLAHRGAAAPRPGRRRRDLRPALCLTVIAAGLLGAALTRSEPATTTTAMPATPVPLDDVPEDDADPTLKDLGFSPGSVDVTGGSRTVTFTVTAADTGGTGAASGITFGFVSLSSPDFARSAYTTLSQGSSGTWVGTLTVPRWTHGGVWHVNTLGLGDRDGNYAAWSGSELADLGHPTTLRVGATADDTAPQLTHLTLSPRSAHTRTGVVTVTVTARASDEQSGIASVIAGASGPGTRHRTFTTMAKVRGTASTYRGALVIPSRRAGGAWHIDFVRLDDAIGNTTVTSYTQLGAAGFRRSFSVGRRQHRGSRGRDEIGRRRPAPRQLPESRRP